MALPLDFQCQIFKRLYIRNWHGTKGILVDSMLNPLCGLELWPWPWTFKVKFGSGHIPGTGWLIDLKWKGCESMRCWTHYVTLTLDLTNDFQLGFSRSNFQTATSQECEGQLTCNERNVSHIWRWVHNPDSRNVDTAAISEWDIYLDFADVEIRYLSDIEWSTLFLQRMDMGVGSGLLEWLVGVGVFRVCELSKMMSRKYTNTVYNARNHIYGENFELKICTCARSIAWGTRTKFQLEIPIKSTTSAIYKFRKSILESSRNVSDTFPWSVHET